VAGGRSGEWAHTQSEGKERGEVWRAFIAAAGSILFGAPLAADG